MRCLLDGIRAVGSFMNKFLRVTIMVLALNFMFTIMQTAISKNGREDVKKIGGSAWASNPGPSPDESHLRDRKTNAGSCNQHRIVIQCRYKRLRGVRRHCALREFYQQHRGIRSKDY